MVEEVLKKIGLSDKEISVYLTVYQCGSLTAGSISKRTKINRGTVYSLLKVLQTKGYVYSVSKKDAQFFLAVEPKKLIHVFEKQEKEIERKKQSLEGIIDEIEALKYPHTIKPRVTFHEGEVGIRQIHQKIIEAKQDVKSFFPSEMVPDYFRSFINKDFIKEKKKAGIKSKIVAPKSKRAEEIKARDKEENRQTKIVPKNKLDIQAEISIFGQSIAMISYNPQEMMGTLIESEDMSNTLEQIFDYVWKN